MIKIILLFSLFIGAASAKSRFTPEDKKKFMEEVKLSIAEHKLENKGRVDLQIIKPELNLSLEDYFKREKFTRQEMLNIKQNYENFSRDRSITPDKAEEEFYNFIQAELDNLSKRPLIKTGRGEICNTWGCEEGLRCAPDPSQRSQAGKKNQGDACREDSECLSMECVEERVGSKNKICEDVYRCYQPLQLNESCDQNPVCGMGSCLAVNFQTAGIGECEALGKSCKNNSDCCSDSCMGNICKPKKICKDCLGNGAMPQRGQVCCEGLYKNLKGVCIPAIPPSVIPQVKVSPSKNIYYTLIDIILSEAKAESDNSGSSDGAAPAPVPAPAPAPSSAASTKAEMKGEIMGNKDKYENFQAERTEETQVIDPRTKNAEMNFSKKSNFETCEMNFKEDFFNELKVKGKFDPEVAMLAFDFVNSGDSEPDYWLDGGSSIHNRLKNVGTKSRANRKYLFASITENNRRMTCSCLDVKGYKKIEDEAKKKFFETSCPAEFAKYQDPNTSFESLEGDASGLKAKRMLTVWTNSMVGFYTTLARLNLSNAKDLDKVLSWSQGPKAKWNDAKIKNYDLFTFNIKNSNGPAAGLGALVGALLAAGIIAVLGGFASASIISTWASIGIISASAVTGAGGLWMIASMKGAWVSHRPEITDYKVQPRTYSCGKKDSCTEYTRTLAQPYNDVCRIHASSSACIKNFVVVNEGTEPRYIIDPWIPVGVNRSAIYMNQPLYTSKIESGFLAARDEMKRRNPGASGGGGKKGGGEFVGDDYLTEVFIEATILGKYAPDFSQESTYLMNADKIKLIKDAAKKFAVEEGFLLATDTENLDSFADYAYEYHFLWPKKSHPNEISYPTVGLITYLEYMTSYVAGGNSSDHAKSAIAASKLNLAHTQDYDNALRMYAANEVATNLLNPAQKAALKNELTRSGEELNNVLTLNAMLNNRGLDSDLSKLGAGFIADQSKMAGANAVANFSESQKNLLKTVGGLRSMRKEQLKSLDAYNKAVANGDKDRVKKVALASKKFSDRFASANGAIGSGSQLGSQDTDANDDQKDKNINAGNFGLAGYGNGYNNSGSSGSGSYGSSISSSSTKSTSSDPNENDKLNSNRSDQSRIAEAIEARNAAINKYQSNENQTLFEKVTNAYIRNYDRILNKKKDKDITDQKE